METLLDYLVRKDVKNYLFFSPLLGVYQIIDYSNSDKTKIFKLEERDFAFADLAEISEDRRAKSWEVKRAIRLNAVEYPEEIPLGRL